MSFTFLLQIPSQVADTAATTMGTEQQSLWSIVGRSSQGFGLVINIALALMLGYAIFVFVERFLALRKALKEEDNFLANIKTYLSDGKIDQAKDLCTRSTSPSARMLEKGIARIGKPIESIAASIENSGKLEVLRLEQRLSFLATAAGAAPMIGFLGTTIGMVKVFIDLENAATLEIQTIAPGIMTAMVTTVGGLIVGIVAFMGYNYLVGRIGNVVYQMENAALEFMDLLNAPGKGN
ncbi:MAG: MotA/TolQ/ExbB proton channel family protein [Crocinitomicaceae bacterium]|jgi:biopolymer transport protein ExbB|nr:MotA/TolQ/ExbB proton channel family protein [Crocinitomicaceae bacterium]MDG2465576.1 MotA/TolQ/ExbB proton channel family protein [Crocinitomicaceae bacterium]